MKKYKSFGKWFADGNGACIPLTLLLSATLLSFTGLFVGPFQGWLKTTYPGEHDFFIFLYTAAGTFGMLVADVLVLLGATYLAYRLGSYSKKEKGKDEGLISKEI